MDLSFIENLKNCECGRVHTADIKNIISGKGAVLKLPSEIKKLNVKKVFLLADKNTWEAAGENVEKLLCEAGIENSRYVYAEGNMAPDERTVGSAVMHFDRKCDCVVAIGSGVINDTGKILSATANVPYIIVATAPSMDGYASATSSVELDGLKVSLPSKCADIVIGDTDILKNAPLYMLKSGLGDMMAKYVSICEWRISKVITGEYYCEEIASLIRNALKKCIDNVDGLLKRDEKAVEEVFAGLALAGISMSLAGVSRPASGGEHYFSHILDMRSLEFGTKADLHGIQCAVGTLYAVRIYEKLKEISPDREKAINYTGKFSFDKWSEKLRDFLGKGAEAMIEGERKEGKYNLENHRKRFDIIENKWDEILKIIDEELPGYDELISLYKKLEMPTSCEEIGADKSLLPMIFMATKDIRDKYVLSRLMWDMGILEEFNI